jgi:hypothetical protein
VSIAVENLPWPLKKKATAPRWFIKNKSSRRCRAAMVYKNKLPHCCRDDFFQNLPLPRHCRDGF